MQNELFRKIPKVDDIILHPSLAKYGGGALLTECTRIVLGNIREQIENGIAEVPSLPEIVRLVDQEMSRHKSPQLRKVINGTGIVIHTNLGRAPLGKEAVHAVGVVSGGYSNLEYNLETASRGSRHSHIEALLAKLTGAEAAIAVNNNAAAVLLALSAVVLPESEIVVSRGELVEIGGSFRIPDVCRLSGGKLREVGTTNKTHLHDFENAINGNTAAILSVHPSNFSMEGFVSKPPAKALGELAARNGIPLIEDLGSGCLFQMEGLNERTVTESLRDGVDIVTFSGDKLLGGPQAGIVAGKSVYIEKMKKHPLARVVRIDKLSLAALEATLRLYLEPETVTKKIPVLGMLCVSEDELACKAEKLKSMIGDGAKVVRKKSRAGGGAMPGVDFVTYAVEFFSDEISPTRLEEFFRNSPTPIIGRIRNNSFILDARTIHEDDFSYIADNWNKVREGLQASKQTCVPMPFAVEASCRPDYGCKQTNAGEIT